MRWEGTDLSRKNCHRQISQGACDSGNPTQGFTTYKVAVMRYQDHQPQISPLRWAPVKKTKSGLCNGPFSMEKSGPTL
jgi:hypothetical protein